jgi:hypothetical protein
MGGYVDVLTVLVDGAVENAAIRERVSKSRNLRCAQEYSALSFDGRGDTRQNRIAGQERSLSFTDLAIPKLSGHEDLAFMDDAQEIGGRNQGERAAIRSSYAGDIHETRSDETYRPIPESLS